MFNRNLRDFLYQPMTVDITLYYEPELKQKSKQWTMTSESAPRRGKIILLAGKVTVIVLGDRHEIILINYLEEGKSNRIVLWNGSRPFKRWTVEKWPRLANKEVSFYQNVPCHRLQTASHPPYFPDLAPCDIFLFSNFAINLDCHRHCHWIFLRGWQNLSLRQNK